MTFGQPYVMAIEGYIHDGWFVLRDYEEKMDRDFLCNLLISPIIQKQYYRLAAGGVVQNISSDLVNQVRFSLPSIAEQLQISHLLNILDERIALQSKLIDHLKSLMDGIVVKHWGGVVDRLTLSEDNDLLLPASTTVDAYSLIAPSAITERGIVLGGDMFGIHISQEHSAEYISLIINAIYRNKLSKYAKGSTIIHLHYGDIKNVEVELPDLKTQLYLVGVVKRLRTKFSIETDYLVKLNKAKQSLLSALFI